MAFSKIILNGVTQIDLTQDTTQADKTIQGYTGHQNDGTGFTGSYVPSGGNDFIVTLSYNENTDMYEPDCTYSDWSEAFLAGKTIAVDGGANWYRHERNNNFYYTVIYTDYTSSPNQLMEAQYYLDINNTVHVDYRHNYKKSHTATFVGGSGASMNTLYVEYDSQNYFANANSSFDFSPGKTCNIHLVAVEKPGHIYLNDTIIATKDSSSSLNYVYALPDDDINIELKYDDDSVNAYIYTEVVPIGTLTVTNNGISNVRTYRQVSVNVPPTVPTLQNKTITPTKSTQTVQADSGYDGLGTVTVDPYTVSLQSKTATPTTSQQTITADSSYDGLSQVTVNAIPSEYIIPTGTKSITANGTGIDVAAYATVDVNVPSSGGGMVIQDVVDTDGGTIRTITGVEISGTKTITENGTGIDVTQYANVDVNVSGGGGSDMIVYTSYTGSGVDKTSLGFDATSHDVYYTIPFDSSSTYIVEGATASTQGLKIYDTKLYSDAECTNLVGYYQIDNGVISQTYRTMANCPWFMLGTEYKVCPYGYYGKIMVGRSGSELFSTNANVMSYINSYGNKLTLKYVGSELESALDNVINGNITSYINDSIAFLPDSMFRPKIYNNITTFQAHNVKYTGNFALVGIGAEAIAFPKFTGNSNNAQAFNGNNYTRIVDFGPTLTQIRPSQLQNAYKLDTLILRCSTLVTLGNINNVVGTKFKSGGTGGTIYIPKVLYDHLGDGSSSDYQSATNWVTVYEYGTITWAQIEGSQYENYYADGTRVV